MSSQLKALLGGMSIVINTTDTLQFGYSLQISFLAAQTADQNQMRNGSGAVQIADLKHNYSHDSYNYSYDYFVSNPHEISPFVQYW
jgi:hypothetical protein